MNDSSDKEVLENEIQDLVQNYSLTPEFVELLRKKIFYNIEKYNVATADNYISEMMQSNFEILKDKTDIEKILQEFEADLGEYFEKGIDPHSIYIIKRNQLIQILEKLKNDCNQISKSINIIQNDKKIKYYQRFKIAEFENYDVFFNKVINAYDALGKGGIKKSNVSDIISNFNEKFTNICLEENSSLKKYRKEISEFRDVRRDKVTYNTNIEKKIKHINEEIKEITASIDSIEKYQYGDQLNQEDIKKLYEIKNKINSANIFNMGEIIDEIDKYKEIVNKIWLEYLKDEESDRYLIHNIGGREYYGEFRNPTISTSLITNKHIAFYTQFSSGIPNGFIIKPQKINMADSADSMVDNIIEDDTGLYHTYKLPYEVEYESIKREKEKYGETLSYRGGRNPYNSEFNEVASSDFYIDGYFFMSFGEGELNPVYEKSKRMADARNIQLKEIDFVKLREKNGLPPMNMQMKRDLLKNILETQMRNLKQNNIDRSKIDEFIDKNYEEFASRYLALKHTTKFNKENILKELKSIIVDYEKDGKEHNQNNEEEKDTKNLQTTNSLGGKGMNILENYNLNYNFGNQYQQRISNLLNNILNGSNNLFAEQLHNNQINNVRSEYVKMTSFIKNVEEYLYNYKDNPNFNTILNSISNIKRISVLPQNERGIYGQAIPETNTLLINPNLQGNSTLTSEERTRLYVAHELGHFVNNNWMKSVIQYLDSRVRAGELTNDQAQLVQEGFSMLDEAITQNNAENFAYKFAGKRRPDNRNLQSRQGVFDNMPYSTNYDFYGEFQSPSAKFAKTLRGIGKYENDVVALDILSERALNPTFALDIMDEYYKDNQYENLLQIVKRMGVIKKAVYTSFGADDSIASVQLSGETLNELYDFTNRLREYREPEEYYRAQNSNSAQSGQNSRGIRPQNISNLTIRTIKQNPGMLSKAILKVKAVFKKIKEKIHHKER